MHLIIVLALNVEEISVTSIQFFPVLAIVEREDALALMPLIKKHLVLLQNRF